MPRSISGIAIAHHHNIRVTSCAAALAVRAGSVLSAIVAGGVALAAQVSDHRPSVPAYTMTPERLTASLAALAALIAAVVGTVALARAVRRIGPGRGRRGAIVALVMGPIGLLVGALVVATADGGLGTGKGLAGGVVAMVLGLIGTTVGGMALSRSRRIA